MPTSNDPCTCGHRYGVHSIGTFGHCHEVGCECPQWTQGLRPLRPGSIRYRVGQIVIDDDGRNLTLYIAHDTGRTILVEHADRDDALTCLQQAIDRRTDLAIERRDGIPSAVREPDNAERVPPRG